MRALVGFFCFPFGSFANVSQSVLAALLLVGLVACQNVELNILHTNDVHAHVCGSFAPLALFPYLTCHAQYTPWTTPSGALCLSGSIGSCLGGFARAYTSLFATIQRFKASGDAYLLADAGDQMQGTPFYDQTGYIISAYFMNLIGYDLFIPGYAHLYWPGALTWI
jgi:2',3'-cyclic-nucleotide 2'-phosphodiesterase (5'-nucleotidase family)